MSAIEGTSPAAAPAPRPVHRVVKAVGPRLRKLLYVVLALLGVLFANSAYLGTIRLVGVVTGQSYENWFYLWMILVHIGVGLLLIVPFIVFSLAHMRNTRNRRNRRAVRVGYVLFAMSIAVLVTGLALFRLPGFDLRHPAARQAVYWAHVVTPILAVWLYLLHRLAGAKVRWRFGLIYGGMVAAGVLLLTLNHAQDPRQWNVAGPKEGEKYFQPSLLRTSTGNFIDGDVLMMDDYCKKCHADVHAQWEKSAHHFSSFNNPAYLASVRETREVSLKRDGNVQASRWCAGCHDIVPFVSGAFDDPNFDDVHHPTAQAGITCTVCHAVTHVNSTRGNADYTIEEPTHYPFATSDNAVLQWINNQLVKAKPSFHKKTFLKPFHQGHMQSEFCSTCHKVHLPQELTHYKEFLRGQNHFDPYLLSGVSGHGVQSFYYPDVAKQNCAECHMPLVASTDFGAKPYDGGSELQVHDHLFPGANTGLAWLLGFDDIVERQKEFLKDVVRVDVFGIKAGGDIDSPLSAPLRPALPTLKPGETYLLETVIRTLKLGHQFTQGTADSNEIWMDVTLRAGDRVIGRSGGMDEKREVDRWSHFVNVFMLDQDGNRINRRNPQDIRVPLYNHQIPPGAGQVVHYGFQLPETMSEHVTIEVKLQYRKFDQEYVDFFVRKARPGDPHFRSQDATSPVRNDLPVVTLASDVVTLPVEGVAGPAPVATPRDIPEWQRWNDYGIGLLLEGKAELRQATEAFDHVERLGRWDGAVNKARVALVEGRLKDAVADLDRASAFTDPPPPPWSMAWFTARVNRQQGHLVEAEKNLKALLAMTVPDRKFDFSLDYNAINELGGTLFDLGKQVRSPTRKGEKIALFEEAVETFQKTLALDSENVAAHYGLQQLYAQLKSLATTEARQEEYERLSAWHHLEHMKYKEDDNIRGRAIAEARKRYPHGNHAAEALTIYPLQRGGAPELPSDAPRQEVARERPAAAEADASD
ncbi:MAG: hypothetical protein KF774_13665 [Planctomyces sp.]|nr:hypothetical protein [Planctomyces sp.]